LGIEPLCADEWWAPVYPITAARTFAMYPTLWTKELRNTSAEFDMQKILDRSRLRGRNSVDADEAIPHPTEEISGDLAIPIVIEPGGRNRLLRRSRSHGRCEFDGRDPHIT
jgi:hypothetical protein